MVIAAATVGSRATVVANVGAGVPVSVRRAATADLIAVLVKRIRGPAVAVATGALIGLSLMPVLCLC